MTRFKTRNEAFNMRKHSWLCLGCDNVFEVKRVKNICPICHKASLQYFASKDELRRYRALQMQLRARMITDLELQPSYTIVINGSKICTYRGDFKYLRDNVLIVEDVKSTKNEKYLDIPHTKSNTRR